MATARAEVLAQGLAAGVIGYLATAIMFAVFNVLTGHSPFYTAALLGATLFYGLESLDGFSVQASYVFAYNGLHLILYLVLGMIGSWLASVCETGSQLWYVGLFFFIGVAFHVFALVQWFAAPVESEIPAVSVWVTGVIAALLMAIYLLRRHPALARQMRHWEETA